MKELDLKDIQKGGLEVLKKFDAICSELGVKYFLTWGTLLGAVRHNGFIPWDDDVDVGMLRDDYEKLIDYLKKHEDELYPFKLICNENNKGYAYAIPRFTDTRYLLDYKGARDYGLGLFVDIYPYDGYGNKEKFDLKTILKRNEINVMASLAADDKFKKPNKRLLTPVKWILYQYSKLKGTEYFINKANTLASKYSCNHSDYVAILVWDTQKKPYKKEWLEDLVYCKFEDEKFYIPKEYDKILKIEYGNYMELPPENERIGHHYYTAYKK